MKPHEFFPQNVQLSLSKTNLTMKINFKHSLLVFSLGVTVVIIDPEFAAFSNKQVPGIFPAKIKKLIKDIFVV